MASLKANGNVKLSTRSRPAFRFEVERARLQEIVERDQNRFDGFRDAVPPNAIRAVASHEPDDQRAHDRHENDQRTQRVIRRRGERRAPALEEKEVREQADQFQQRQPR